MKFDLMCLFIICFSISCSYHPYIPAGDMVNAESPSTVGKNRLSICATGGIVDGSVFEASLVTGGVKVKYGLSDNVDVGINGFGMYYPENRMYADYSTFSAGTMILSKVSVVPKGISVSGGLGYGISDLGNYTNMLIGLIVGYENRYVTPINQAYFHYGIPVNPHTRDLSLVENDQVGEQLYTPGTTIGFIYNAGFKFPIWLWMKQINNLSLYTIIGYAHVWDESQDDEYIKMGCGVEYSFGLKK